MLKKINWSNSRSYRTGRKNEPLEFYLNALSNSNSLILLLGYFSSSAISLLSLGFAKFLYNNGNVKIIINNILSEKDKNIIENGLKKDSSIVFDLSNIKLIKQTLDEYGTHFFECIAWLISQNKIEFKIIKPKNKKGISHYKSGIFSDGNNTIGFKGSCNFTANGLLENLEELDIFLSWENSRSTKWIDDEKQYFDEIFTENADFVEYLNIQDVQTAIYNEFGDRNINELLVQENELVKLKKDFFADKKIEKLIENINMEIEKIVNEPKFPYPSGPREYQIQAYNNWANNDNKGIFAMATGTGKTITSLNCLLNIYKLSNTYKAIILVPTIALIDQWKKECAKFNFKNVITVSSENNWNDSIAFFNTANKFIETSFIIISTYASFVRPKFQLHFRSLPNETLLVADEVHNIGAPSVSIFLPAIHLSNRIGLSATPERKYDIEGNISINDFFNDKFPYVFSFTMKEAMEMTPPALCKYTYYPHKVYLVESELNKYMEISKQLVRYFDNLSGTYKDCQEVTNLLLKRKRIIHKAYNKKDIFKKIIQNEFSNRGNLKYTLIYVPEGNEPDDCILLDSDEFDYATFDEYRENDNDTNLISEYSKIVKNTDESIMIRQYTSKTKNRNDVIKDFENGKVHVLTSMKCLDEGVDVPRSELAIFCSSTGNPRQFIQRRGRILRTHPLKINAVIHDLVVVPNINKEVEYFEMERNLLKKELERVIDFSNLSMNKMDTYLELKDILEYYNLSLYE